MMGTAMKGAASTAGIGTGAAGPGKRPSSAHAAAYEVRAVEAPLRGQGPDAADEPAELLTYLRSSMLLARCGRSGAGMR